MGARKKLPSSNYSLKEGTAASFTRASGSHRTTTSEQERETPLISDKNTKLPPQLRAAAVGVITWEWSVICA